MGFFNLHRLQSGSWAHSASLPTGTEGFTQSVKRPGREADHSPPLSQYAFTAWCLIKKTWYLVKHSDKFTFIGPTTQFTVLILRLVSTTTDSNSRHVYSCQHLKTFRIEFIDTCRFHLHTKFPTCDLHMTFNILYI